MDDHHLQLRRAVHQELRCMSLLMQYSPSQLVRYFFIPLPSSDLGTRQSPQTHPLQVIVECFYYYKDTLATE